MDKISLIVPCYNEEKNIKAFYSAIKELFNSSFDGYTNIKGGGNNKVDFELMFVDDGSKDNSFLEIQNLNKIDSRVKCISFSRNFGKEAALFSGIRAVTGDCCVLLDADLQHPPATIVDMYKKWKEGFEVVEGVKTDRGKEGFFHKLFTKVFYSLISKAVGMDMKNSSDYKLLDRKVINVLAQLKERNTFFRALSFWVGFTKTTVYYEVQERNAGSTKWSTKSLIKYAINNVICFSYTPLHIISTVGTLFIILAFVVAIDSVISFIRGISANGFPTLIFCMLAGFGAVLVSLGIIGIYIAQIYDEIKGRPQYIEGKKIE